MKQRHKHADVIIAWANGEEIEIKHSGTGEWVPLPLNPSWAGDKYRIKPTVVKKEGWVNIHKFKGCTSCSGLFKTEKDAGKFSNPSVIACIRIEWEEEQ